MKTIFIWICILSLICMNAYAYVIAEPDTNSNNVIIKGCEQGNELMLTITKVGKTIPDADNALKNNLNIDDYVYYLKQIAKNEDNYTITIPFADDADGGIYNMTTVKESSIISFSPLTMRLNLINNMNANAVDKTSFIKFISTNYDKLGINAYMYEKCTNKLKANGMAFDALNVKTATLKETVDAINGATLTQLLNEGIALEFEYIINASNFVNRDKIDEWQKLITNDGKRQIVGRLVGNNYANFSELERNLLMQMVICEITFPVNTDASRLPDVLISKNTYVGLELAKFTALSQQHRAEILNKIKSDKPETVVDLQNLINKYVDGYTSFTPPRGGGGGGGGGNLTITIPTEQNTNDTISNVVQSSFSDLGGFLWASSYINKLSDMKIISGYEDNTFRPGAYVSRAEFIAMISRVLYDNFDNKGAFNDITVDHWAYKYIATASADGIIKGIDGNFMPDEKITREDVAVILYRAAINNGINKDSIEKGNLFIDDNDISEYAKDAVNALKSIGIVNGNEAGAFRPLDNITRAETSKIVYKFMELQREVKS